MIIAAGGVTHLLGMLVAHTPLPVIGNPVKTDYLDDLGSLLSVVQMLVCHHRIPSDYYTTNKGRDAFQQPRWQPTTLPTPPFQLSDSWEPFCSNFI